ncbi:superoxide reductase [Methylobacter tundripaludum]|uniref:Superoxide reductase n=1 Tax=Methylobacter tundripaludum TaxID=173365 RepID=A0A2S6HKR2_9GAMM|nr:desulfoferrodoxin family protein [Methylobacter tundripaludum]PPK78079.1 superoxide reductase [Methylobacter tundripaludum]
MERRDFIRLSVASAGASLIAPALTMAAGDEQATASRDIYYTKEAPGRWAGKVATHLPTIEITKAEDITTVKIVTPHEIKGYEHYIVKHVLLDKNYKFIDEHLFDPTKDSAAVSTFTLKNYSGAVYALSLCNKHDLWLNSADA